MNISLENAVLENCDQVQFHYDNLYVKGRNIRYIHIPKEVSTHYFYSRNDRSDRYSTTYYEKNISFFFVIWSAFYLENDVQSPEKW